MSFVAYIDILAFLFFIVALISLFYRLSGLKRDLRYFAGGLLIVTLAYIFFMLLEWLNISPALESVEDLVGASVPMMWAFFLYSFIQSGIKQDLALNKENLRITLNSIGDAVIATDVNGRITQMNPAAEILTGIKSQDAARKKIDDLITFLESETRRKISNPIAQVLESGKVIKLGTNTILHSKENRDFYISDSAAPIYNDKKEICGAVLVFSDMTERFNQQQKIRENEERIKLALEATQAGLWDWYMDSGKVVYDERWAEIIGYTLKELEPLTPDTWKNRVHPGDLIALEELIEEHSKGKTEHIEHQSRLRHKNGGWVWIMARGMIVQRDKKGNPLRMTGTIVDVTNQKKAEEDLKKQIEENQQLNRQYEERNKALLESIHHIRSINEELKEAKKIAEESTRVKSAFLANMSHEIRTPMNGIIGFSELLNDKKITDEKRKYYAGIVIDSSRQLLNIVNDILDVSRMETGKVALSYEEVVVNELI